MRQTLFKTTQANVQVLNDCKKKYNIAKKNIFNNILKEVLQMEVEDLKKFVNEYLNFKGEKVPVKFMIEESSIEIVKNKFKEIQASDIYHSAINYFCNLDDEQKREFLKKY